MGTGEEQSLRSEDKSHTFLRARLSQLGWSRPWGLGKVLLRCEYRWLQICKGL